MEVLLTKYINENIIPNVRRIVSINTYGLLSNVFNRIPKSNEEFNIDNIDGSLNLSLSNGRIKKVGSRATRLLGLLNFDLLTKRLSLDFDDVTKNGFYFDNITGVEKMVVMDNDGPGTRGTADPITVTIAALAATTTKMPATFEYDGSIIVDLVDTQDFNYNAITDSDNDALTTDFTITTGYGADSVGGSGGDDTISTGVGADLSLIHISEPTRPERIS